MKRILPFLLIFLTINGLTAQGYYQSYNHHDISIGYGLFGPDQFNRFKSKMLDNLYPQQLYVRDNYSSVGTLFLTYRHIFRNDRLMWGITVGISNSTSKIYNAGQYEGDLERKFYTAAIEWQYRYYNRGPIQVYSGLGLGFTYGKETFTPNEIVQSSTGNTGSVAYQFNVVGIRIGKRFGGFIEFGYGYKGIINLGFSTQLY